MASVMQGDEYFTTVRNLYNRNLAIVKMEHICNTKTFFFNKIKNLNHKIDIH